LTIAVPVCGTSNSAAGARVLCRSSTFMWSPHLWLLEALV
jgi:hypothetical protein